MKRDSSVVVRERMKKVGIEVDEGKVLVVPVGQVRRLETQPRIYFDPVTLEALGNSIKANGQAQPCLVIKLDEPDENGAIYELIDGERRWRAIQLVELLTIKIIVVEVKDKNHQHLLSLISNFNREDHTHAEKVRGVFDLRINGVKNEDIAVAVGKGVSWVINYYSLSRLDARILAKMDPPTPENERLSFALGLRIATLKTADEQIDLFKKIEDERKKGTSPNVITEIIRRVFQTGDYSRRNRTGDGQPREKKLSDDLKSFHALVSRIEVSTMKLEDYPEQIMLRYFQKHGGKPTEKMVEEFRKCAVLLNKYADSATTVLNKVTR